MSRRQIWLVVALIGSLTLAGLIAAAGVVWLLRRAKSYVAGTEDATPIQAGTEHASQRFGYRIAVPGSGWRLLPPEANEDADVAYTRDDDVWFLIVAEEAEFTLDELAEVVETNLRSASQSMSVVQRAPAQLDGLPALRLETRCRMHGVGFTHWYCVVQAGRFSYQLVVWCQEGQEGRFGSVLDEWLASFRLLERPDDRPVEDAYPEPPGDDAEPSAAVDPRRLIFLGRAKEVWTSPSRQAILGCAVSPDGDQLALATPEGLALVDLDSGTTRSIPGTEGATAPAWSAGGERVLASWTMRSSRSIERRPASSGPGSPPRRSCRTLSTRSSGSSRRASPSSTGTDP